MNTLFKKGKYFLNICVKMFFNYLLISFLIVKI